MRKEEQRVWDSMRRNAPPGTWMERVENLMGDGMPDVWVGADDRHSWVELKAAVVPVRATTPLLGSRGLRKSQINWHRKAAARNLPVYTLTRDSEGALYLVHCRHSEYINQLSREGLRGVSCADSWESIFEVLNQ